MENDINAGLKRPGTERKDAETAATERPKEYFSVRLTLSGAAQEFDDPRQAGEAFFRADPAERPSVAHIDGNTARTLARTEIHGVHETGEARHFKSLPDSHAPDAEFRAGFLNAMEASLTERLSIITQSIPGLDNIYGENVRLSLESAAGMKLYLAANDKKTAGEISDALGKTTKLSVSDSVSRDRDFMQRRSVSRRMEERPLLTPDEVRRLNPDQAILIPERQNPLLVHRIVYFQDPTFRKLFDAQKGALPYPPKEAADVQVLAARMEALERRLAERMVVDFVRPQTPRAEAPVEPEPKLAAEIVAREEVQSEAEAAAVDAHVPVIVAHAEVAVEPQVHLDVLKPPPTISVARMNKFTLKLQAHEA